MATRRRSIAGAARSAGLFEASQRAPISNADFGPRARSRRIRMTASPCLFTEALTHPARRLRAQASHARCVRTQVHFIFPTALCLALAATCFAQSRQFERSFPVSNKTKIAIQNARKISISPWNKSEVAITADSAREEDFRIKLNGDKLEIWCHPLLDKAVLINLRVPWKSTLRLEAYDYEIEIEKPVSAISLEASKDFLHFIVPETATFDAKGIAGLLRLTHSARGTSVISTSMGNQRFGIGSPLVKVSAHGQRLSVSNVTPGSGPAASVAAQTIAKSTGSMGRAIRESAPVLGKAHASESARPVAMEAVSPAKESDTETLKLETYLVNLNVSVTDRDGKAISGLSQADFNVFEDDDPQRISFFSPEQSPFNLVLLIDLSGSVKQKAGLIKEAALHFVDLIGPNDSVAVITFTTDVNVVSHLTKDRERLRQSIRDLQTPVGGTAFYDSLGYVLTEELSKVRGQRNAVIAITDGQDNAMLPRPRPPAIQKQMIDAGLSWPTPKLGSWLTFDQLLEGVLEADTLVYPIHLQHDNPLNSTAPTIPATIGGRPTDQVAAEITEKGKKQLQELAEASGGRLFSAARIEDLKSVYEQVVAELRTVYSIGYNTKNLRFDGKFRRTRVTLNRPGTAVRSRRGYYATPRQSN